MSSRQQIWETYVSSWRTTSTDEKQALFEKSLSPDCLYTDPFTRARGWNELTATMMEFHQRFPGLHFVTIEFLSHHDRSIAKWEMRNSNDETLDGGVSHGQYDEHGKLVDMAVFFETSDPGR